MKNFNKLFFKLLIVISFLLSNKEPLLSQVQPLFYNGDFENYSTCPSNFGQINFVNGLTSCNITPDYFNTCNFVNNGCRTIVPYSGNGCIGMFGAPWNSTSTQYETVIATLDNPTVSGAQYEINFYLFGENKPFAPCYSPAPGSCFSFGFYFFKSSNPPSCPGFPIPAGTNPTPDVSINGSSIIAGSWNNYSLLYTANDVYDRVLFGWFPNAGAYTSACTTSDPKSYVFMDKLCMDAPGNNCNICNYSIDATTTTSTICSGSSITLSGTKSGGVISTTWSTSGDGTFNNTSSLGATYSPGTGDISAGTVSLTLTTDDPAGSCTSKSDMVVVSISNKSNATINSAGPFCVSSSSLNLSAVQSGGVWSGSGIINATTGAFSPTTAGAGNHTITYMINGACGDTSTTNIQVIAGANATINSAGPFCANSSSLNLSAVQSGGTWSGSGIINTTTGAFSPTTAGVGSHTITYMINGMCGDTSTVTIQVVSKGNATINSAGPFCANNSTLNLSAAQSGGVWSGTGIINATTGAFSPNMAGAGIHTITYMINSSCGDTATTSIEVIPNANTTINSAGPFCVSSSTLNLSAAQAGGTWSGSGITNTNNGTFSPNIAGAGNHVITYSISGSCGGSSTTTVQVIANANASINSAGPFCLSNSTLTLSAAQAGGVWSGTGITNTSNGLFSPNIAGIGNHIITYMINGACGDTSTTNIQVIADANATINSAGPFCKSASSLNLSSVQSGGVWSGSGITNATNGTFSPNIAGIGNHAITYMINGICGDTSIINIQVIADAEATINSAGPFCVSSSSLNLSAVQAGGIWSGVGIINSVGGAFSPSVAGVGNHTITYIINGMCGDTSTTSIQVTANANATINSAGPFCANSSTLNLSSLQSGGIWSGAGITNSINGTFDPSIAGIGTWNITYSISGTCGDSDTVLIKVNKQDTASFSYSETQFCIPSPDPMPIISGTSSGVFTINNSGVIDAATGKLFLETSGAGSYLITYSTMGTCPDQSSVLVTICDNSTLLIPNVFSPNKDDVNDFFQIKGNNIKSLKVAIFNRWGNEIYSWEGIEGFWDGKTASGNDADEGTYFYVLTITDKKDNTSTKNGFLSLFR